MWSTRKLINCFDWVANFLKLFWLGSCLSFSCQFQSVLMDASIIPILYTFDHISTMQLLKMLNHLALMVSRKFKECKGIEGPIVLSVLLIK